MENTTFQNNFTTHLINNNTDTIQSKEFECKNYDLIMNVVVKVLLVGLGCVGNTLSMACNVEGTENFSHSISAHHARHSCHPFALRVASICDFSRYVPEFLVHTLVIVINYNCFFVHLL